MTKSFFGILALAALFLVGCNVQESIVFDEQMGGEYKSSFDLSQMMQIANQGRPPSAEKTMKVMDTTMVFSDMLDTMKDSIATLSPEKQAQLQKLKGMVLHMQMDETAGIFRIETRKVFKQFKEIEFISYDMEEVFNIAKSEAAGDQAAGPGGNMLKQDKVRYTYTDNTFRRVDPKMLVKEQDGEMIDEIIDAAEEDGTEGEDEMMAAMLGEFEELLKQSKMELVYTFPKKIKSFSYPDRTTISDDGKTMTFSIDWQTLLDGEDKALSDFSVVLED